MVAAATSKYPVSVHSTILAVNVAPPISAARRSPPIKWTETGYFDVAAATEPLLHLWSLGVEERSLYPLASPSHCRQTLARVRGDGDRFARGPLSFAIERDSIGAHPMAACFLPFRPDVGTGRRRGARRRVGQTLPVRARIGVFVSVVGFAAIVAAALLLREEAGLSRLAHRDSCRQRARQDLHGFEG